MIDSTNTSPEWQTHTGQIVVSGIGSCEQHGPMLPLATDTLIAGHFARLLAHLLDAALLPEIAIATSIEHRGYRGSFSLKPETAMSIIRDLAEEIISQNFKYWIIINGHGGNFFLAPVIRDINSQDKKLKIILFSPWDVTGRVPPVGQKQDTLEIHAGYHETSLMMHLFPSLVRQDKPDNTDSENYPLRQNDLTTFGVGHFTPEGTIGCPSLATANIGREMEELFIKNAPEYVNSRIARIENLPSYAGKGGLAVRKMNKTDISDCMRLKRIANWNQLPADWDFFVSADTNGNFVMVRNGAIVGTVTTINYQGVVSWIGMVLVDPACRRMGIATKLMHKAISHLSECTAVKLDATADGREVYLKMGFEDEFSIGRFICRSVPMVDSQDEIDALADASRINSFDRQIFGADRGTLLSNLLLQAPDNAFLKIRQGEIKGFVLGRKGENFFQMGPLVANSESDALSLLKHSLHTLSNRAVLVDIPLSHEKVVAFVESVGFRKEREFMRMWKGPSIPVDMSCYFVTTGPEFG